MTEYRPPVVIREKTSRLTGSRIATTLVIDRDFTSEERASFYRLAAEDRPQPTDFEIDGRTVRYECDAENAEKWRLVFEISVVKACRPPAPAASPAPRPTGGVREKAGLRKLHLG